MCIINGGARCKFVVLIFKQRFVSWDSDALRTPATAYAQTLAVMPRHFQNHQNKLKVLFPNTGTFAYL